MCANDLPLFFAKAIRGKPASFLIADKDSVSSPTDSGCRGQLFHGKRRFWFQMRNTPDCEFGFSLYDVEGRHVARAFRVVVPKKRPYVAASPDLELAQLAKRGSADAENFITYASKLPEKNKQGKYTLQFGNVFVVPSVKNFMVEDENKDPMFMIYRASNSTCTVKAWPPMTPLVAFTWAVAVITTDS
jgi:hypothetical protein